MISGILKLGTSYFSIISQSQTISPSFFGALSSLNASTSISISSFVSLTAHDFSPLPAAKTSRKTEEVEERREGSTEMWEPSEQRRVKVLVSAEGERREGTEDSLKRERVSRLAERSSEADIVGCRMLVRSEERQ
jgi:hypothetical protein